MLKRLIFLFCISIPAILSSCNQDKVRQIPISDFFKSAEKSFFRISPDGKYVSYLKSYKGRQNIVIQSLEDGKERMAPSFSDYSIRDYSWTYHNQIVFIQDIVSLDQYKMFALDVSTLKVHDVLALDKGRIRIFNNQNKD